MPHDFQISRDSQALFITLVTKDRLPVFRTDKLKMVLCLAINESRTSGRFLLFAYVIMVDHVHLLTNKPNTAADVLRVVKGITARRVIDYLKGKGHLQSLAKLRHGERKRKHQYALWQTEKNVIPIFTEEMFMQKVNYIHLNPVRDELANRPTEYQWSSARIWQGCPGENEPLRVDMNRIRWRSRRC